MKAFSKFNHRNGDFGMSFYSEQQEAMIDSNTPGAQLHTLTNLAATPQANVIIVHGLAEYAGRFDPHRQLPGPA
jgi:hypothetical protein